VQRSKLNQGCKACERFVIHECRSHEPIAAVDDPMRNCINTLRGDASRVHLADERNSRRAKYCLTNSSPA
jgi:hypothetical protein